MEKKNAKIREKYISPVVEALPFVMEKGFTTSINGDTDFNPNIGYGDASEHDYQTGEQWEIDYTFSF